MRAYGLPKEKRGRLQAPDRRASGGRSGEGLAGGVEALYQGRNKKGTCLSPGC
jgi:hypothetical protein